MEIMDELQRIHRRLDGMFETMDLTDLDAYIFRARQSIRDFQTGLGRDHQEYGSLSLRLGLLLITRFVKERKKEDFTEAKQLEVVITRHKPHIQTEGHQEHGVWRQYQSLVDMGEQIINLQELEAHLDRLNIRLPSSFQPRRSQIVPAERHVEHPTSNNVEIASTPGPVAPETTSIANLATSAMTSIITSRPMALTPEETFIDPLASSPPDLPLAPPFTSPPTLAGIETWIGRAMSGLHSAGESTEVDIYSAYCHVLAYCYFSRYRLMNQFPDLEEALDYSIASFHLFISLTNQSLGRDNLVVPQTLIILLTYLSSRGFLDLRDNVPSPLPRIDALDLLGYLLRHLPKILELPLHLWLLLLGKGYYKHYAETQNEEYAEASISHYVESFNYSSENQSPNPAWMLKERRIHLGLLFQNRYDRYHDSTDLEAAIENFRLAEVQGTSSVQSAWLGLLYWTRFIEQPTSASEEDKEQGIFHLLNAISLTPINCVPPRLGLSTFLLFSYRTRQGGDEDLGLAIDLLEGITHQAEPSESLSTAYLVLAEAYKLRHAEGDSQLAFNCFKRSAEAMRNDSSTQTNSISQTSATRTDWETIETLSGPGTHPVAQFNAAEQWGEMALERDLPECIEAFQLAASLFHNVVWMGNKVEDKHEALRQLQFGGSAAAAAVKFDKASKAVEWLEQGFAITVRQILQLRQDVGDLAERYPDLAQRLSLLSERLRLLSERNVQEFDALGVLVGTDNHRSGMEYQKLVEKIRSKPGFEGFLRPLPYPRLAEAAAFGPVIMISFDQVTESTYALIILNPSREEPIALPLPAASFRDLQALQDKFDQLSSRFGINYRSAMVDVEDRRGGRPSAWKKDTDEQDFELFLKEIWSRIVQPIFNVLGKNSIRSGRVWWCPAGVFSRLPLHAAAPLDCTYTSSYTYGLEVLLNARSRMAKTPADTTALTMSVVGMEKHPGQPHLNLPSVRRELQVLRESARKISGLNLNTLENESARMDTVMSTIKSSQLVHLACHGTQDLKQPLNSHLILSDGKLEMRRILMEDLKSADFAFLSACQTATGERALANESVHLSGGFMAAGYKGVIGTLWRIADEDAPRVAKEVYDTMFIEGRLDITKAAEGLDKAVKKMRESRIPTHRWVPFIHVGV